MFCFVVVMAAVVDGAWWVLSGSGSYGGGGGGSGGGSGSGSGQYYILITQTLCSH